MKPAWRQENKTVSLSEVHSSVPIPSQASWGRKMLAFLGPGLIIAVGYMDPGNWATDLAGGAQYGYVLLSVILFSNFLAILLQHLSLKLGIVTERDLAQACRDHYSKPVSIMLWLGAEIAIASCDLAEVIGSAIALNLLFHLPIIIGIFLTAFDVLIILFLQYKGFRIIESIVGGLIVLIGTCFAYEMMVSNPSLPLFLSNLLPRPEIVTNPTMLYIAIGILGATVMPHNLYLHSSIVQTRAFERNEKGKKMAIHFAAIDSAAALTCAFFINAAILVLAAAAFHNSGHQDVAEIQDAYHLLSPVLGASLASIVFAIALLASGQNATLTGTLAGQIVMEGFLNIRLRPWVRRMITRLIAIIPAAIVASMFGEKGTNNLLILSQVILSLQLSFAVIPLVMFTCDKNKMGKFVNSRWLTVLSWISAAVILVLNVYLVWVTVQGWLTPAAAGK
jgi:manganese transport protein